jgi:hypothetical protein
MRCVATMITPASASSLWNFLSILHAISLLVNLVMFPLISLMMMPLFSLVMLNLSFTYSSSSLSRTFLSRYSSSCTPNVGNLVILETNATLICTGLSIQRIPPWTQDTSCLMHKLTFLPCPKCSMSKRFIIHELYSLVIYCAGSSTGLPRGPISPVFIKYFSSANFGNLFTSCIS